MEVNLSYNEAIEGATLEPFAEAAAGTLEVLADQLPGLRGLAGAAAVVPEAEALYLAGCVQLEGTGSPRGSPGPVATWSASG